MNRSKLTVFSDYFYPAYKAGGPVRSLLAFAEEFKGKVDLTFVTRDRDLGDPHAFGAGEGKLRSNLPYKVISLPPGISALKNLFRLARTANAVYFNSFFSLRYTIFPLWATALPARRTIIIAPRGELIPAALIHKRWRKKIYIAAFKLMGGAKRVVFHAANLEERAGIEKIFGGQCTCVVLADLFPAPAEIVHQSPGGPLRLIFVARIHPHKNLRFAIDVLKQLTICAHFEIVGPASPGHDPYWQKCLEELAFLPPQITWNYEGGVLPHRVFELLSRSDVLFLPSQSESFGQSIAEALWAGCVVLISDQTPWRNLEAQSCGWDFSLERPDLFVAALAQYAQLSSSERLNMSASARAFARRKLNPPELLRDYARAFHFTAN